MVVVATGAGAGVCSTTTGAGAGDVVVVVDSVVCALALDVTASVAVTTARGIAYDLHDIAIFIVELRSALRRPFSAANNAVQCNQSAHRVLVILHENAAGPENALGPSMLKACLCGRRYDDASWVRLRFAGYQRAEVMSDLIFEMRQCECGSALMVNTRDLSSHGLFEASRSQDEA